jgi:hypothetical protein
VRELYVVGLSPDGRQLLCATQPEARKPGYAIVIDGRLEAALRGEPSDGDREERPTVSPRDIQAALRAGATVEEVAERAGLPTVRVARYAGPVLSERERVLEVLLEVPQAGRRGLSTLPLGQAVAAALAKTAYVRSETESWTAYRRPDGDWVARLTVVVRGRTKQAEWTYDASAGTAHARDPYASTLGHAGNTRRAAAAGTSPARPRSAPAQLAGATASARSKANGTRAGTGRRGAASTRAAAATSRGAAATRKAGKTGARTVAAPHAPAKRTRRAR